jgi:hypothetical protein
MKSEAAASAHLVLEPVILMLHSLKHVASVLGILFQLAQALGHRGQQISCIAAAAFGPLSTPSMRAAL